MTLRNASSPWVVDGNQAAADVAYRASEVVAIYPITPASPMGELSDAWSAARVPNLWGQVPRVVEMQSEAGAAGAVHGALQGGALATTFTASQGLLLMIPEMFKIAGELSACVIHVAARTVATHALSIFGDHSDVYAVRPTGFAMLASSTVQEAHDLALVAHAATLWSRIPFLHFFDGFRTSHELTDITRLDDAVLRAMLPDELVAAHRARGLSPDHPVVRGTAHNPDTYFQAREAVNPYYADCVGSVQRELDRLAQLVGRRYALCEYAGSAEAERVVVAMGSGARTVLETARHLAGRGERVGAVNVRLYRPFPSAIFVDALPPTVRRLAVLDRSKEPGAAGEPLYLDVVAALHEQLGASATRVSGGRYGLSSKELTPAMVAGVFAELARHEPKRHFTVGIRDDVTHSSIPHGAELDLEPEGSAAALFYGIGSDGTVSASHSTLQILARELDCHVQGYFVHDSKKSGTVTVSHLRWGSQPIHAPYLVRAARFIGCHQWSLLERVDVLEHAERGATVLLDAPLAAGEVWDALPFELQERFIGRGLRLFVVDAHAIAREVGLGGRINTIMQACFFAAAKLVPVARAAALINDEIAKSYAKHGEAAVADNRRAVELALTRLTEVPVPATVTATRRLPSLVDEAAPEFVKRVTAAMMAGHGDRLPVSAFPPDGTWPTGTARWEKRNLALEIPVWDANRCIQCNKCVLVCPHAAIRAKIYPAELAARAPLGFKAAAFRSRELAARSYTLQVAPEDCTGCGLCVEICPVEDATAGRALALAPQAPLRARERDNFGYFLSLPEAERAVIPHNTKHVQLLPPLFEYSGACSGCGETPYLKLLTQLFGDRLIIANATGCSSIFGGNLPTAPWTTDAAGRGPAWCNSLFEDNAEFGLGIRLALDQRRAAARALCAELEPLVGDVASAILAAEQGTDAALAEQRQRVATLRGKLASLDDAHSKRLRHLVDDLVDRTVWIVGGDGWAYDIGYGGLDHVLASGEDVNVLVLDTEGYSNTGGQQSKATPRGAVAKFAAHGKTTAKKDLALMAMAYGEVYVARVAFGADDQQTVKALYEAQSYHGPSLVIAYSHCITHGYELGCALEQHRHAVASGYWPLLRFDPRRRAHGKAPLVLDSKPPREPLAAFTTREARFGALRGSDPARAEQLAQLGQDDVRRRYELYRLLAADLAPGA